MLWRCPAEQGICVEDMRLTEPVGSVVTTVQHGRIVTRSRRGGGRALLGRRWRLAVFGGCVRGLGRVDGSDGDAGRRYVDRVEDERPYNPLDRLELGKSVERALLARPLSSLPPSGTFSGAGLYAIYYDGPLPMYSRIAPPTRDRGEVPIYVGRARPPGARQGLPEGLDATTSEPKLRDRLREHAKSLQSVSRYAAKTATTNLDAADFSCRYLVAEDIWVPLGETLLIGHYRPVWNVPVDGFGNHAPGKGRKDQARSRWDELHPGRTWALELPAPDKTATQFETLVVDHLAALAPPNLDATPEIDVDVLHAIAAEAIEQDAEESRLE